MGVVSILQFIAEQPAPRLPAARKIHMHSSLLIVPIRRAPRSLPFWREHRRASFHHPRRRHRQRGMTLLEMMIVMAILALIMGLVVGPRIMDGYVRTRKEITAATVRKYASEAYPMWAMANPGQLCPPDLEALGKYLNKSDPKDTWGRPYHLFCGPNVPDGASGSGIFVVSDGPDQTQNTADDIKSW